MENEEFYEQVAAEITANHFKPGLWAMAFSEAIGDEGVARSLYIKLRVLQLIEEAEVAAVEALAASNRADDAANEATREQIGQTSRVLAQRPSNCVM